jgi:hypothetical protein
MATVLEQIKAEAKRRREQQQADVATEQQAGPTVGKAELESQRRIEKLRQMLVGAQEKTGMQGYPGPFMSGTLGGLGAPITGLAAALGGELAEATGGWGTGAVPATFGERFRAGEEVYRGGEKQGRAEAIAPRAQEIAGSIVALPPLTGSAGFQAVRAGGPAYVAPERGMLSNMLRTGTGTGILSGAQAFGTSEQQDLKNRLTDALLASALGFGTGAGIGALGSSLVGRGNRATAQVNVGEAGQFNIPLTRGQATGDVAQQKLEQSLLRGGQGGAAQNRMTQFDTLQQQAARQASEDILNRFAPSRGADVQQAGTLLNQQANAALEALRAQGGDLMNTALATHPPIEVPAAPLLNMPSEITAALTGANPQVPRFRLSENTPVANEAMSRIKDFISTIPSAGKAPFYPPGQAAPPVTANVPMADLENLRQVITSLKANTPLDQAVLAQVKQAYGDIFDQQIQNLAQTAPTQALADLNQGRDLYRRGASILEPRGKTTPAQKAAALATGEGTTGEQVASIFRPNKAGNVGLNVPGTLDVLGPEFPQASPVMDQVRQITMAPLFSGGPQAQASAIDNFLTANRSTAERLLTADQIAELQRYSGVMKTLTADPRAINPSQSSYGIMDALKQNTMRILGMGLGATAGGGPGMAVAGTVGGDVLSAIGSNLKANRALSAVPPPSMGGAAGSTAARELTENRDLIPPAYNMGRDAIINAIMNRFGGPR